MPSLDPQKHSTASSSLLGVSLLLVRDLTYHIRLELALKGKRNTENRYYIVKSIVCDGDVY